MDRNNGADNSACKQLVALRKESVDRNDSGTMVPAEKSTSLSARRAWIETLLGHCRDSVFESLSARRAWIETSRIIILVFGLESLSARRAWIETFYYCDHDTDWIVALRKESVDRNIGGSKVVIYSIVALRKESVDRNGDTLKHLRSTHSRSPQGERG